MKAKKAQQIATIAQSPADVQKAYLASWLVACTFPHRDPKTSSYTRKNGDCTLSIQTGLDADGREVGLPYGALVRLLLFWIITECNRLKWAGDTSRRIHLGESMNRFVQVVGLDPATGRGKRGDATRLREMMQRLFACRVSFTRTRTTERGKVMSWLHMEIAPEGELWWDTKTPEQTALFDSWIEVGEKFYEAITANPVPFDFRAVCALKHSPMAMDLYTWLTWRTFSLKTGQSVSIPLHGPQGLAEQIGSQYKQRQHFKAALAEGLDAVRQVWPQMNCTLSATHLTLTKSPVPIPSVPAMQKRRRFGEVKPEELSVETLVWFKATHPNITHRAVWNAYRAFLKREHLTPRDIDAHFKDYATKWVQGEFDRKK